MAKSMKKHSKTTKRVIHYTGGTMSFDIQHTNSSNSILTSFCDSYWVGNSNGKKILMLAHVLIHGMVRRLHC